MGAKTTKSGGYKRPSVIIGVFIGLLLVIFLVLYFANKPNYRDLEREFKRISANLPADWQLVSESSNKGTLGLFCLNASSDALCPFIHTKYRITDSTKPIVDQVVIKDLLLTSGYLLDFQDYENCIEGSSSYYCSISGSNRKIKLAISIGVDDKGNKNFNLKLERTNGSVNY